MAIYLLILIVSDVGIFTLLRTNHLIFRFERWVLIAYANLIFFICLISAHSFQFHQSYAPFVTAVAVTVAYSGKRAWEASTLTIKSLLLILAIATGYVREDHFDFLRQVKATQAMADTIPADQKVLMFSMTHPITRQDASYFGSPLADARNRLCRALISFQTTIYFPPCDFSRDLEKNNAFMIDAAIWIAMPEQETASIQEYLRTNYQFASFPFEAVPLFERISSLRPPTDGTMQNKVLMIRGYLHGRD